MGFLSSLIINAAHYLGVGMGDIWDALKRFLGTKWAVLILVVGWAYLMVTNAEALITIVLTALGDLVIDNFNLVPSGTLANVLAIANTFFPLAECCVMTVSYGLVVLGMTIYRFIKTQIPSPFPGGGGS